MKKVTGGVKNKFLPDWLLICLDYSIVIISIKLINNISKSLINKFTFIYLNDFIVVNINYNLRFNIFQWII